MPDMFRRTFLRGAGGLIVASILSDVARALQTTVAPDRVAGYLAIAADGSVTVYAGKVDVGTGARAALRQIVAEELGISPERIPLVEGDRGLTPDQGGTGGSTGIAIGGMQIRQAAATARQRLLELAIDRLNLPAPALDAVDGAVRPRARGQGMGFGVWVETTLLDIPIDRSAKLRDPDSYTIVGTSYPRPDLPAKLTGRHTYVRHHRVDGMLHARTARPPSIGARLLDVDTASIGGIPGARIVGVKDFLAVVAEGEWDAVREQLCRPDLRPSTSIRPIRFRMCGRTSGGLQRPRYDRLTSGCPARSAMCSRSKASPTNLLTRPTWTRLPSACDSCTTRAAATVLSRWRNALDGRRGPFLPIGMARRAWKLFEEVNFDPSTVTTTDWSSCPILTFPDVPHLDIALIDRRYEPPLGAGEAATAPVAAAIGNAIFDAAGIRLREVPFTPACIHDALGILEHA